MQGRLFLCLSLLFVPAGFARAEPAPPEALSAAIDELVETHRPGKK